MGVNESPEAVCNRLLRAAYEGSRRGFRARRAHSLMGEESKKSMLVQWKERKKKKKKEKRSKFRKHAAARQGVLNE